MKIAGRVDVLHGRLSLPANPAKVPTHPFFSLAATAPAAKIHSMKLKQFRVCEFRSVWDSGMVDVDEVTCLVGKNEAGKTALLKALYRLSPIVDDDARFNATDDYPRKQVGDYQYDVESKRRAPATAIQAWYELDDDDVKAVTEVFGEASVTSRRISHSKS